MDIKEGLDTLIPQLDACSDASLRYYTSCRRLQILTFFLTIVLGVAAITGYWQIFWVSLGMLLFAIDLALWIVRKLTATLSERSTLLTRASILQAFLDMDLKVMGVLTPVSQNAPTPRDPNNRDYNLN